jgi:hypothetical protein
LGRVLVEPERDHDLPSRTRGVAKKRSSRYRPGERGWIKVKNPNDWRRDSEIEAMQRFARS